VRSARLCMRRVGKRPTGPGSRQGVDVPKGAIGLARSSSCQASSGKGRASGRPQDRRFTVLRGCRETLLNETHATTAGRAYPPSPQVAQSPNKLKTPLESGNHEEEKILQGVEVTYLPILRLHPGWSFLGSFLCWALVHRRDFQIIHAHNPALGVIACIVGWALHKQVAVKLPSNRAVSYLRGGAPFRQLRRWILLRKVTRFVSVSTEMTQSLQNMGVGADRITWIPNGVEYMSTSHCHNRRALKIELLDNADAQVVLFVGRLVEEKGLERLLKVWAAMPCRENAILYLVGNGPLRGELKAVAARLDVLSSVRFLGHQPHVSKFYAIADLFVLPLHTEGKSNALLEAMAAGLPVVASAVGGNKDVIDDQVSGFLVNWDDTMLCGQVLSTLLAEPSCVGPSVTLRKRVLAILPCHKLLSSIETFIKRSSEDET
jgi:glycosyltransferase involved in cell wall biosynthesis